MKDEKKLYTTIGHRIEKFRKERLLTQSQLSEKMGIARTSIVQIEKGDQRVTIDKLYKIAKILDRKVQDFLPEEEEPNGMNFDSATEERLSDSQKKAVENILKGIN